MGGSGFASTHVGFGGSAFGYSHGFAVSGQGGHFGQAGQQYAEAAGAATGTGVATGTGAATGAGRATGSGALHGFGDATIGPEEGELIGAYGGASTTTG